MSIRLCMFLLCASFCSSVNAAEPVTQPGSKHHAQKHQQACPEHATCPLPAHEAAPAHPQQAASSVTPVAVAAPVAAAAPASKTDAVLSDAEGRALAQRSGCFTCHAIDRRVVGPAWKAVADKYRGAAGAAEKLVHKVKQGGSGVWGSTPMPANSPRVNDADIQSLVRFILALK